MTKKQNVKKATLTETKPIDTRMSVEEIDNLLESIEPTFQGGTKKNAIFLDCIKPENLGVLRTSREIGQSVGIQPSKTKNEGYPVRCMFRDEYGLRNVQQGRGEVIVYEGKNYVPVTKKIKNVSHYSIFEV